MVASIIRTVVTYIVALLLGWAARIGLHLDSTALTLIISGIIGFVYYTAARLIEQKWPTAGRWLLSLGLVARQPVYVRYAKGGQIIQDRVEQTAREHWPQPGQM